MSREQNEDEVRTGYVSKMGTELGELFHALSSELQWIHWKWCQYRTLFGDKPSRVDLLNDAASLFFRIVQDVFFEDTVLGIARLVGPPKSVGKPNLAITRLKEQISDSTLASEVDCFVEKAKTSATWALDWRHRQLAHRDLSLALKRPATPLAPVSRKDVEESLDAIAALLNHIELWFCRATTSYRISPLHSDAEDLLYVIRDGLAHQRLRHESELSGQPLADNITNQEPI